MSEHVKHIQCRESRVVHCALVLFTFELRPQH